MDLRSRMLSRNGLDRGLSQMSSSMGSILVAAMVSHFAFHYCRSNHLISIYLLPCSCIYVKNVPSVYSICLSDEVT
jgi:hypothetical protein